MLEASSDGRVRSIRYFSKNRYYQVSPTFGAVTTTKQGYQRWTLVFRRKTYTVARLVCAAFHGPPPFPKADAMHVDENSLNNLPENLQWGSRKRNLNAPGFLAYCKTRIGENSPVRKGMAKIIYDL